MKAIISTIVFCTITLFFTLPKSLSIQHYEASHDMKLLLDYLDRTEKDILTTLDTMHKDIRGFAPKEKAWSAQQILDHVVTADLGVFSQIKAALDKNPDNIEDLSANDAWLIGKVNDRGTKVLSPLPPPSTGKAWDQLINDFKNERKIIKAFLKSGDLELRYHYGSSPYGKADCYQMFLVLSAHSMRHHHQLLDNIKAYYEQH